MKTTALFLFLALAIGLTSCETVPVVKKPSGFPPEIDKAQQQVWDLQFQLYQAQHDLAITQINQKENELMAQRNTNPALYSNQYVQVNAELEQRRGKVEERYGLAQQWYNAVQGGDMDGAQTAQQQMNQP